MSEDSVTSTAPRLSAALNFIRRGWPVVPLHDVVMGFCSCNDGSSKHAHTSAGKHPIAREWQHSAIMDEEIMRGFINGRPGMNFGIKTGVTAGVWVLDVDPKHEGDKRLAELTAQHGNLPDTYTQRTGSGGLHYFWLLPRDFTPTNSKGSLPPGLDVRGEGGFVVAAPCVSGIGPYETLLDLPVAQAPGWLLDMIRPRVPADVEHRAAMAQMSNPAFGAITDRGARYAHAAVAAELARLADAVPGTRGTIAFHVACNLCELVNSPWAQLSEDQVWAAYAGAAERAMRFGGDFDLTEAYAAQGSARKRIGAQGRAAPDSGGGGVLLGWSSAGGVPPFGESSPSAGVNGFGYSGVVDNPVDKSANEVPFSSPTSGPNGTFPGHRVPFQSQAWDSVGLRSVTVDGLRSKWLTVPQLELIPPPSWLINGWLTNNSLAWIIGKPGEAKSFASLSMALCVATGLPWYGSRTRKGRVGYVVAEGATGMRKRVKAWQKTFYEDRDVEGIEFLPEPVQVMDPAAWDELIWDCTEQSMGFIIVDTQARSTVGMEENSSKEMGFLVGQLERLRQATGACVLTVHHTPKAGGTARGSGAIEGAAQTMLYSSRTADQVTLTVTKQKDDEPPVPLSLSLSSVDVGTVPREPGAGESWFSAGNETVKGGVLLQVLDESHVEMLKTKAMQAVALVLTQVFPGRGATKSEAWSATSERRKMPKSSFYRAWDQLVSDGRVVSVVIEDKATGRFVFKRPDVPSEQT